MTKTHSRHSKLSACIVVFLGMAILAFFVIYHYYIPHNAGSNEEHKYTFSPQPETISGSIYNCDGGIFYLSLTDEYLAEITVAFDTHPDTKSLYLTVEGTTLTIPDNEFYMEIDQKHFAELRQSFDQQPVGSSIVYAKQLSTTAFPDQSDIPSDQYRVHAFLTASLIEFLQSGIETSDNGGAPFDLANSYCLIQQDLSPDGTRIITYPIYYDELLLAKNTIMNQGVRFVVYVTNIYPLGKNNGAVDL